MLRQCDTGYQLGDGHRKINHLLFMDDLKLYGRNDHEIKSLVHTVWIFKIDKEEGEAMCRICKNTEETVTHIISQCQCSKLAQLEYKKRRDKVAGAVHWSLCENIG